MHTILCELSCRADTTATPSTSVLFAPKERAKNEAHQGGDVLISQPLRASEKIAFIVGGITLKALYSNGLFT